MTKKVFLFCFLAIVAGCSTIKRYKRIVSFGTTSQSLVTMSFFSAVETEGEKKDESKTLWDLQGEGQQALIDKLGERYKDNDDFKEELNNAYLEVSEKSTLDYTTKRIKIILSVNKFRDYSKLKHLNNFSLADRIEFLKFSLVLEDTSAKFIKWNKFETEFADIDIADVTFEKNLEATLGAGTDETIAKGEIKGGLTKTEEQKIKYRYAVLNGRISPDSLEVEEEGTREIDLNGNIILDVTIQFKRVEQSFAEFIDLRNKSGECQAADSVKLYFRKFIMPQIKEGQNLSATLNYNYIYRNVKNKRGAKTFIESDDKVKYYEGKGKTPNIVLLNSAEIKPIRFLVTCNSTPIKISSTPAIEGGSTENIEELIFSSQEKANAFCEWLKNIGQKNPTRKEVIHFGNNKLFYGEHENELTYKFVYEGDIKVVKITAHL
ncbi:MAG: hypothetical protein GC181_14265 [Bacteroidetes bacterium]|nr:hypothetical protein [Bacteroidota bacterium]